MTKERDETIIDELVQHVLDGTTGMAGADYRVPATNFTDARRLAAEVALLKQLPVVVLHHEELPKPGSFVTRTMLGVPLIISRRADGAVQAYINVCRHRGGQVEAAESGVKRVFTCRYHGWTYDGENGALSHAPYNTQFKNLDYSCHGLMRVHIEERHGLIWALLKGDRWPIEDYLGVEVEEEICRFRLENTVVALDETLTVQANWKLVMDGAIDTTHAKFLHPAGVGKLALTNTAVWREYGRHGEMFTPRTRMVAAVKAGDKISYDWRQFGGNLLLYPNSMVLPTPDHVEFWTVWPSLNDPSSCTIHIRFLIDPAKRDERMEMRMKRSWEILQQAALDEDFPMEVSIQANARACPETSFIYGRHEQTCHHLHRQLDADLVSGPLR
jgi:phenylpropionate dioxygenase-like ring-hydroxylating dioxygenase large terminal subunit